MYFLVNFTEHEDIKKSEQKAKKESPKPVQNKKAANDKGKKNGCIQDHI